MLSWKLISISTLATLTLTLLLGAGCQPPTVVVGDGGDPPEGFGNASGPQGTVRYEINGVARQLNFELLHDQWLVHQGDILLGEIVDYADEDITWEGESDTATTSQAAAMYTRDTLWPSGIVPFEINANLINPARVHEAIEHWERLTDYRFVLRTSEQSYLEFVDADGCASYVGRRGGRQEVFLHQWCTVGNTIHEIGHALGHFHEQSREDRDEHVQVLFENIELDAQFNFQTYLEQRVGGFSPGPYDLGSVMHYGSTFFSKNGRPTLLTVNGQEIFPNRQGLSAGDILGARENLNVVQTDLNLITSSAWVSYNDTGQSFVAETTGDIGYVDLCVYGPYQPPHVRIVTGAGVNGDPVDEDENAPEMFVDTEEDCGWGGSYHWVRVILGPGNFVDAGETYTVVFGQAPNEPRRPMWFTANYQDPYACGMAHDSYNGGRDFENYDVVTRIGFNVGSGAPQVPNDLAVVASAPTSTISWTASDGANRYELGVYSFTTESWVRHDLDLRDTTRDVALLPGDYATMVRAGGELGMSSFSKLVFFTVD